MFTGIVETVGTVLEVAQGARLRRIRIEAARGWLEGVRPGDSISVDGACLTPIEVDDTTFLVEAIGTTLARTRAGSYAPGTRVNLERALPLGGRLDGHLVQGHVDGVAHLEEIREEGEFHVLRFRVPPEVHRQTIPRGSIALAGVSLTVSRLLADDRLEVAIIPHTRARTTLGELRPGDAVNVEGDLIGKYVGTLLRGVVQDAADEGGNGNPEVPTDGI